MEVYVMKRRSRLLSLVLAIAALVICASVALAAAEKELILFHAGSLSKPMAEIEARFEKLHPDVDVKREAGGSRKLARKIIDLDGKCDLYFSADYNVIENLLRPEYADWNVMFASNEIVLMYGPKSRYASEITKDNWYDILMKKDVKWGNSEPDLDPCGYRAVMVLQLAEKYYNETGFFDQMMNHPGHYTRPKAIELVAQVESGAMDYAFEYRSVAVQHGFDFIELPAEINLRDVAFADNYKTATVEVAGKEPGTKNTLTGAPIVYGFTIPKQAPNLELAKDFASFVLSKDGGLAVFSEMGQGIVGPSAVTAEDNVPEKLVPMLEK
jgi:molybdate/tungstate transport system substrate-binding protein